MPSRLSGISHNSITLAHMATHSDKVRAFYETEAYLAQNVIIPIRARLVQDLLRDVRGSRILDLGCGDGAVSRPLLAGRNLLTLVDFSPAMIARARESTPTEAAVEFIEADIADYHSAELFDVVICVGVIAHVPSPRATMQRVARLVRPGGLCVVQITDNGAPLGRGLTHYYRWRRRDAWPVNVMTRRDIDVIAAEHGLREVSRRRYGLLLPGSGRLPHAVRQRVEESAAKAPLSSLAADLIILFRRE
jgi:SAM-dependent methyltransferase